MLLLVDALTQMVFAFLIIMLFIGDIVIEIIPVLVLFVLIFYGTKISQKGNYFNEGLSEKQTHALKGICSILIVLDHLGASLSTSTILSLFHTIGFLGVGVFFLLSGYGIEISRLTKSNYMRGFLAKRLISLLIPVFSSNVLFIILLIARGNTYTSWEIIIRIVDIIGLFRINGVTWYIYTLAAYCIVYYLCNRLFSARIAIIIIAMFVLVWVILIGIIDMVSMQNYRHWYGMNFCFVCGIILAHNKKMIYQYIRNNYVRNVVVCGILAIITLFGYYVFYDDLIIGKLISRNIGSVCATAFVLMIIQKIQFGNKILKFLGTYSFEIYLVHMFWISFFKSYIGLKLPDSMFIVIVLILTIALAVPLHLMNQYFIGKLLMQYSSIVRIACRK